MIEVGKKNLEGVEGCGAEGERSGQGVFPSAVGVGSGQPRPIKCLRFLPENGAFWLHFLPYARFFGSSRGGMSQVAQW